MAAKSKFTDQQMRDALEEFEGDPHQVTKAAGRLSVSVSAVSQRVKRLEKAVAPMARRAAEETATSVWDIRTGLEENFGRVKRLIASVEDNGAAMEGKNGAVYTVEAVVQLTGLLKEARAHHEVALRCVDALYRVEEIQAFQNDVIAILAECDPTLRVRIMDRIKKRRGVRAAFA